MQIDLANSNTVNIALYTEDAKLGTLWSRAFDAWMMNYKSQGTIRAYQDAWRFFLEFTQLPPWKIGRSHVVEYIKWMRKNDNSNATVQLRLSALASFYDFVCRDYTVINDAGREVPLYDLNPASSKILRKRVDPYSKANYLMKDEIKRLLSVINRSALQGSRDYALLLAYILTGRRNSEIRHLRWGDISVEDDIVLYRWSGKNVEGSRAELPRPVYDAILSYLDVSGRLPTIGEEDYVFTAINDHEKRPPNIKALAIDARTENSPLSLRQIGKLLKKYCRMAGITKPLCCHSLRHSATMMRRNTGETMEEVSKFLHHKNFATTQVYLHSLEGNRDRTWKKVGKMLDL